MTNPYHLCDGLTVACSLDDYGSLEMTVIKDKSFNLTIGKAGTLNITPGTNNGVTVALDGGSGKWVVSGTLSANAQIQFGMTMLDFSVIEFPQNRVVDVAFN